MAEQFEAVARERLVDAGFQFTRARRRVMATLAELAAPATIPTILDAAPDLVQSSLYRNLTVLEAAGLVTRVDVGDDRAFFELSELVTEDHHHHMVCRSCSTVVDVSLSAQAEHALEVALADAAAAAGFEVDDHRVDLVGTCATCR